ncbi:hypothetical protein GF415_01265 [Candidatus Micrarchaeota archaeon]|nr:hypothetical protein [Candidatus Micrarchaeota archaeon]
MTRRIRRGPLALYSVSDNMKAWIILVLAVAFLLAGCPQETAPEISAPEPEPDPEPEPGTSPITKPKGTQLPNDTEKLTPAMDNYPPMLHLGEYEEPVPMPYPISTKGAEDSAFISPDGGTFYFFYTPDVRIPVEKQVLDGVTGIYLTRKTPSGWSEPERIILSDELSMDGCLFVQGSKAWFCSVRGGNYREVDIWTAEQLNGEWSNWENAGEMINLEYEVGELHITRDGNKLYFHSEREGGKGGYDIYVSEKVSGDWQEPEPVEAVNTEAMEGWPFINQEMDELWFTRTHFGTPAIYKSELINGTWQEPELIISQFAGEPTLDDKGNIYFTHHFYDNGTMLEADIYVAYKKND